MHYTVYKTTNDLNGKVYIGKHQTTDINDTYLGSGTYLKKAIAKYGKSNFTKEILFIFSSEEEMNKKEAELVTEEFISQDNNYNGGIGGEGGPHFKGRKHSEDAKQKMSEKRKGQIFSVETRNKISASNRTRVITDESKVKMSISKYLKRGKTLEEAKLLYEASLNKKMNRRSKSEAMSDYYKNQDNRRKKADEKRKLHLECDLENIKIDFDLGMKPKQLMEKYDLTKSRYDHIRKYYLKGE